jgi:tRNA threonylcarbamoyladenosine biosynthesis protein TsaE
MEHMSTATTFSIESDHAEQTEKLGELVGQSLKGGEVIELTSDLGGGKTAFVRGLARGMGSTNPVSSPTFTISKVYKAGDREMHHFDFYRLPEAGLMQYELADLLDDPKIIIVIEWAGVVEQVLPEKRLSVAFAKDALDDQKRTLSFTADESLKYLLELL